MLRFQIPTPEEFSFERCYEFLLRSPRELLHQCVDGKVVKLTRINGRDILFEMFWTGDQLQVQLLNGSITKAEKAELQFFIEEWFDLVTDLKPFYAMAAKDSLLKDLVQRFHGYRIIGQPDLFESLVWAVLGQQINLQFAYTLKQRFVETYGEKIEFKDRSYYLFPQPDVVSRLTDEHLLPLQFSRQKSKYTVLIAEAFVNGEISKQKLTGLPLTDAKEMLMKIKGVGNWTANYALMKTFRYPDAFPLEDAGVHNAIRNLKKLKAKPTLDQVRRQFKKYKGWEAYATLYLWKSL